MTENQDRSFFVTTVLVTSELPSAILSTRSTHFFSLSIGYDANILQGEDPIGFLCRPLVKQQAHELTHVRTCDAPSFSFFLCVHDYTHTFWRCAVDSSYWPNLLDQPSLSVCPSVCLCICLAIYLIV